MLTVSFTPCWQSFLSRQTCMSSFRQYVQHNPPNRRPDDITTESTEPTEVRAPVAEGTRGRAKRAIDRRGSGGWRGVNPATSTDAARVAKRALQRPGNDYAAPGGKNGNEPLLHFDDATDLLFERERGHALAKARLGVLIRRKGAHRCGAFHSFSFPARP